MPRQFKLFFIFLLMLSSALIGVTVFADDYGLGATAQEAGLAKYESNLPKLVGQVVGAALSLTGVLFFGLMIYSGIIWMIDRGNDERAEQAKNTITAAIIGLVIVLAAYAITKFAFEAVPQSGASDLTPTPTIVACGTGSVVECNGKNINDGCGSGMQCSVAPSSVACTCELNGPPLPPPSGGSPVTLPSDGECRPQNLAEVGECSGLGPGACVQNLKCRSVDSEQPGNQIVQGCFHKCIGASRGDCGQLPVNCVWVPR